MVDTSIVFGKAAMEWGIRTAGRAIKPALVSLAPFSWTR
jgi:hypothetical protein